jgi:phosphoglycolate phosphatase
MQENCKYKPKAIIFDWDNTLVDSWPVIEQSFNQTAQALNYKDLTIKDMKIRMGHALRHSFPEIFGDLAAKAQRIYREFYYQNRESKLRLLPHAQDILTYLRESKITLFVVSNKIGDSLRKEIDLLNLTHFFDNIVGSLDTNFDKPHIAPVNLALKNYSYNDNDKENILFVGDSLADYQCAQNIGFKSILVHTEAETRSNANNALILDNLSELKAII